MSKETKRLIKAVEGVFGLLIEGLTDTQTESWSKEIDELLEALEEAKKAESNETP
jgi:transcription antitermination factor NusG